MFGKMGDMMSKLKEAKRIADEIKLKLDNTFVSAESAGGDVKVEMTGNRKITSVSIAPALQHGDKNELEKHLLNAMNSALQKAEKLHEEEMKNAAGGLF